MGRIYIVKQRARIDTIAGPVNLPYGTTVLTSQRIKNIYEDCLKTADFL